MTIIGNNKIFTDNIQNFSDNAYCRVELVAQLHHSIDHDDAIAHLKLRISQIPNVLSEPVPDVEILKFELSDPVFAIRPYCQNENYWQVYFDTNKAIRETFIEAAYPVAEEPLDFSKMNEMTGINGY